MKIIQLIETFKMDINNEEGIFVHFAEKILQRGFQFILLIGIPFLLFVLFSAFKID